MPPTEILDLFSTLVGRLDLDLGARLDPAHAAPAGTASEVGKTLIPRALLVPWRDWS